MFDFENSENKTYVKIAQIGGDGGVKEIAVADDATVSQALTQAGFDAAGYDVRVNNLNCDLTVTLRTGDVVTLVPQIKGGC